MNEQSKIWCPAIELNENNEELILKAEVPGVEIHHLNIQAESKAISISGIHDRQQSPLATALFPSQLHYGQLQCKIPLPVEIQVNQIQAELIDGILTITMPKLNVASATN